MVLSNRGNRVTLRVISFFEKPFEFFDRFPSRARCSFPHLLNAFAEFWEPFSHGFADTGQQRLHDLPRQLRGRHAVFARADVLQVQLGERKGSSFAS